MRSPKGRVNRLIEVLEAMGIPAHSRRGLGVLPAVEVQVVMALLRLLDNPFRTSPSPRCSGAPSWALTSGIWPNPRPAAAGAVSRGRERFCRKRERAGLAGEGVLAQLDAWRTKARRTAPFPASQLVYDETRYLDFVSALPRGRQREANLLALSPGPPIRHVCHQRPRSVYPARRRLGRGRRGHGAAARFGRGRRRRPGDERPPEQGAGVSGCLCVDLDRSFNLADSQRHLIFHAIWPGSSRG